MFFGCCGSFWCAVHYLGVLFHCTCILCSIIVCVFHVFYCNVVCAFTPVYTYIIDLKKKKKKKFIIIIIIHIDGVIGCPLIIKKQYESSIVTCIIIIIIIIINNNNNNNNNYLYT